MVRSRIFNRICSIAPGVAMKEIEWYYPKKIEEAAVLVREEGILPHGGGTWILMGGIRKTRGIIDLDHLPLRFFREKKSHIEIGPCLTYADLIENIERVDPGHVLSKALSHAASTPLRNRITVGGTISAFPAWSDLMGPLLALETEVSLIGQKEGQYTLQEYARTPGLRKGTLISSIRIKKTKWDSYYHREVRTRFDYPAFTVTILARKNGKTVEDARVVVVGCSGKFLRLIGPEEILREKKRAELKLDGRLRDIVFGLEEIRFARKKGNDPVYTKHLCFVALERGLEQITGG
jgi:CO/xanthine dehydrogenase FAD-binding subunit